MRSPALPWTLACPLLMTLACGDSSGGTGARPDSPSASASPSAPASPSPPAAPAPLDAAVGEPTPSASETPPRAWPALPESPPATTPEGIPILAVDASGGARWDITPAWNTLIYGQQQASDGRTTFVAVRRQDDGSFDDVVIRGGEVRTNVLRRLADAKAHPGGCGAVHDGTLLLSAPVPDPAAETETVQAVWVMKPDGTITRHTLPAEAGTSAECKGAVEGAVEGTVEGTERFSLFAQQLAEYDGERFRLDLEWRASQTTLTRPLGPRYCFAACSEHERAGTDPTLQAALEGALGDCYPRYAVYGDLVAARCQRSGTAVRVHVPSGRVETLGGLPTSDHGADHLYLTRDGHVVVELALLMRRYAVWPAGASNLGAAQELELGEILAQTSPTVLVRGLPEPLPRATVGAVALGQPLSFDARDATRANYVIERGPAAHEARSARAAAVLPEGDFVIAHEAAVQL
ncbi:MAG: hypothetical protein KDK70_00110, partial [Myxococcales bacterium]|nr:hypothetical protein [Myxococcales bacterium]